MIDQRGLAEQIIDFLEDHQGEKFSAEELATCLEAVKDRMIHKLRNLLKHHEVEAKRVSCLAARKIYGNNNLKRGLNLYFIDI